MPSLVTWPQQQGRCRGGWPGAARRPAQSPHLGNESGALLSSASLSAWMLVDDSHGRPQGFELWRQLVRFQPGAGVDRLPPPGEPSARRALSLCWADLFGATTQHRARLRILGRSALQGGLRVAHQHRNRHRPPPDPIELDEALARRCSGRCRGRDSRLGLGGAFATACRLACPSPKEAPVRSCKAASAARAPLLDQRVQPPTLDSGPKLAGAHLRLHKHLDRRRR